MRHRPREDRTIFVAIRLLVEVDRDGDGTRNDPHVIDGPVIGHLAQESMGIGPRELFAETVKVDEHVEAEKVD